MESLVFLKLGGSVITDKLREASAHPGVIRRIASEVKRAQISHPDLRIVLGHGSGSYGHYTATKLGYSQPGNWHAFAETAASAARLNRLVTEIFLSEGVDVVSMQPSASALCRDGELVELASQPIRTALERGLSPIVYGDVGFDENRQKVIISTEMIFAYLAPLLRPSRVILAGIVDGVFTGDPFKDSSAQLIPGITPASFGGVESLLRGSHGVDVTGGMLSKVRTMLELVQREPSIQVHLLNALRDGMIERALTDPGPFRGTLIRA